MYEKTEPMEQREAEQEATANPYQAPVQGARDPGGRGGGKQLVELRALMRPLNEARTLMKVTAVMFIIGGAFSVLTIWGIVVAWLPIWMGVVLMRAAGAIDRAYAREDEESALVAMASLRTYFRIMGILMLIYIGIIIVAVLAGVGAAAFGASRVHH